MENGGFCSSVDVYISLKEENKDKLFSLLIDYGNRNIHFVNAGISEIKNFDELMSFLGYSFKKENGMILINNYSGKKLSSDEFFWKLAKKEKIINGYFKILGSSFEDEKVCINF